MALEQGANQTRTGTSAVTLEKKSLTTQIKQDLDAEIEDAKLRADSGKKSTFSSSLYLSYNGSSLSDPLGDVRPNVEGVRLNAPVTMSGMVGLRYRFSKNTSFYAATGISKPRPFDDEPGDEWEANNIMTHLNSTFRYDTYQVSSTWIGYVWTQDFMRDVNQVATVGYSVSALGQIGQSSFRGGIGASFSYTYFDDTNGFRRGRGGVKRFEDVQDLQTDITLGLSPSLQYRFNDRFNIYTSLQLLILEHNRDMEALDLNRRPVSQNLGLGITVFRDFFLAPNLDFRPGELNEDKTSLNLSAVINI